MIRDLLVLFRVEARMQLRQPVTLLLLLLLPMLTGPGMVAGITWYTDVIDIDGATSPDGDRKPVPVSVPDPVAFAQAVQTNQMRGSLFEQRQARFGSAPYSPHRRKSERS